MLGLADHPAPAAPAVPRGVREVVEAARRLAGCGMLGFGLGHLALDLGQEPAVAGETEDVVDAVRFAPGHQLLAGEARIGAQQDRTLGQRARI